MGRNILTEFRVNPVPEATAQENDLEGARTRAFRPTAGGPGSGVQDPAGGVRPLD